MTSLKVMVEGREQAKELLESGLQKEIAFLNLGVEKTKVRIRSFEEKYEASLKELKKKRTTVEHDDLIEWEGELEILERLRKRLAQASEIKICS